MDLLYCLLIITIIVFLAARAWHDRKNRTKINSVGHGGDGFGSNPGKVV